MDRRSADGSSIESDRSGYFPDQASGKFSEPKSQENQKPVSLPVIDGMLTVDLQQGDELILIM